MNIRMRNRQEDSEHNRDLSFLRYEYNIISQYIQNCHHKHTCSKCYLPKYGTCTLKDQSEYNVATILFCT